MKTRTKPVYSAAQLSRRVAALGRAISRDYAGRPLEVIVLLENGMVFAADLLRHIRCPLACWFLRCELRDVTLGGYQRREVFFSPEPDLRGRDVLLVDAVLQSGVTMEFLRWRLAQTRPRSLRIAVLLDKAEERKVDLRPDYFGFRAASNYMVGYGLAGRDGRGRNLPYIAALGSAGRRPARRPVPRRAKKAGRRARQVR